MDLIEFDPLSTADPKTDSAGIFGGKVAKVVADRSYKAGTGTVSSCLACTHPLMFSLKLSLTHLFIRPFSLMEPMALTLTPSHTLHLLNTY